MGISDQARADFPAHAPCGAMLDGTGYDMIDAIARWCEALQGHATLREGLGQIGMALDAEAVALARVRRDQGGASRAITWDRRRDGGRQAHPGATDHLDRSHAATVLGRYVAAPRAGTIWYQSMCEPAEEPALARFQKRRHIRDLAVIPLALEERSVVCLELHFTESPAARQQAALNAIVGTLTRTWAMRAAGLFGEAPLQAQTQDAAPRAAILSLANPASLSRAETRVCFLLRRGLTTKAVRAELAISASTLRTHLGNIYAKTGTTGRAALMYLLLAERGQAGAALSLSGMPCAGLSSAGLSPAGLSSLSHPPQGHSPLDQSSTGQSSLGQSSLRQSSRGSASADLPSPALRIA